MKVSILGMLLHRVKEIDTSSFISYCACCYDKIGEKIAEGKVYLDGAFISKFILSLWEALMAEVLSI